MGGASSSARRSPRRSRFHPLWSVASGHITGFARHRDPLAEAGNWVALTIGSHLPFWPLYVLWAAGRQALPSALLTMAMAPAFLAVPLLARRSSLQGRMAVPLLGIANTVFTIWILGLSSGTEVFLFPCAALAALIFRRSERRLMLALTALPLGVWYVLQTHAPTPLHHYDADAAHRLVVLNVCSIGVIIVLFGWFQVEIYRRMEQRP